MRITPTLVTVLFVASCAREQQPIHSARPDSSRVTTSSGSVAHAQPDSNAYPVIRGLYLNRFAAQNASARARGAADDQLRHDISPVQLCSDACAKSIR